MCDPLPSPAAEAVIEPITASQIAIIGAGPSGLAGARNLQKLDIPFVVLESHADVGGLWDIDNPLSTVYESAHLISSKHITEFSEFPMAADVADYPSHRELRRYFHDFVEHFELRQHIRFNARVLRIEPVDETPGTRWRVSVHLGEGRIETSEYRGVIIANGTLSEPKRVDFKGSFAGQLLHTADYKRASVFKGKRVLIVGAGNSGCDVAVDAVHHAQSVDISVRRGYYFVPKYIFGRPVDTLDKDRTSWLSSFKQLKQLKQKVDGAVLKYVTGDPARFGFPKPNYKMYALPPVVNSLILHHIGQGDIRVRPDIARLEGHTVHFKNGRAHDYDLIMMATGYVLHYPFIERTHLNWQGMAPRLYLNIFTPAFETLAVLGMIEASGVGWQDRYEQAELVARYFKARDALSPTADALRAAVNGPPPDLSGGHKYLPLERMAYYVHKDSYRAAVRKASAALDIAENEP